MTAEHLKPLMSRKGTGPLRGRAVAPGDKSVSHRALILGAMTVGETAISGLLEAEDVLNTAAAMRALGADVVRLGDGAWRVHGVGVGGFAEPKAPLDFGNSGTGARLTMGAVATTPITTIFTGDASLQRRPMKRVLEPLGLFGLTAETREGGLLPATLKGARRPVPIEHRLKVASAQVKSALLLAALNVPGRSTIIESAHTRDHTERMLTAFGAKIEIETLTDEAAAIHVTGETELKPSPIVVPSDPSSAAFPLVAALIVPGSEIRIENVMLNPRRIGLIATLKEMGGFIHIENERDAGGEIVGDLLVKHSALTGVEVPAERAPSMIDEYPVLAVAAAFARGNTVMHGLEELRVKESDRLSAIAEGLRANHVLFEQTPDSLTVHGMGDTVPGGGTVATHMDHRIAMSFLVMGLASHGGVTVDDGTMIATSFPSFQALMQGLGAEIAAVPVSVVIAIDGTAACGKGTLAKKLAQHYGFAHLDSGALYRLVALGVIDAKGDPSNPIDALRAARTLDPIGITDNRLRSVEVGEAASHVAAIPEVRAAILQFQRDFASKPPGGAHGAVIDGRDIGTVICPDAAAKLFIDARPEVRAQRRWLELKSLHQSRNPPPPLPDIEAVKADLVARDARDRGRAVAPLRQADDAVLLDTSDLGIEAAFAAALDLIKDKVGKALAARHRGAGGPASPRK